MKFEYLLISSIPLIILTAGSSNRMGTPKALLPWKKSTLIKELVDKYLEFNQTVIVVSGSNHNALLSQNLQTSHIVENTNYKLGMGKSIAVGVNYVQSHFPKAEGVFIVTVDQPFIPLSHLQNMLAAFKSNTIVVSSSEQGYRGIPSLFSSAYFEELAALEDDRGAKPVCFKHKTNLQLVKTAHEDLDDMDTPDMYQKLKERLNLQ
ncbi:MAG: nucleotidyltransferase family protein [Flavobacteriaceae bacterium]